MTVLIIALFFSAVFLFVLLSFNRKYSTQARSLYGAGWQGILSPLPGEPAIVYGKEKKQVVVYASVSEIVKPEDFSGIIRFGKRKAPVIITEIVKCSTKHLTEVFSEWTAENTPNVYRITCILSPSSLIPDRFPGTIVLSVQGKEYLSRNSFFYHAAAPQKFLFASDLHIAAIWDYLEQKYADFALAHSAGLLRNPNKNFELLIEFANGLYANGEIDALVLGGDLVEYKYASTSGTQTNYELLMELLEQEDEEKLRSTMPIFTVTGNHDYRLYPYKPVVVGLASLGAEPNAARQFFKERYRNSKVIAACYSLRALCTDTGKNHVLDYYYRFINGKQAFGIQSERVHYIFLSSGSDALVRPQSFLSVQYIRHILNAAAPLSYGLTGEMYKQAEKLLDRAEQQGTEAVIFSHAPLWFKPGYKVAFPKPLLNACQIEYYDTGKPWRSVSLRAGTALAGAELISRRAEKNNVPVFYISGHTHFPAVYIKETNTGSVGYSPLPYNEELEAYSPPGNVVNIHSGPAGMFSNELKPNSPSVLLLSFSDYGKCVLTTLTLPSLR